MAVDLLAGLNVLDLGQGISAPFCARLFADLGARVVKVEPPGGDRARRDGPFPQDAPDAEKSGLFLALNTNKRGITLNLETPAGRELLLQLAEGADLLVEDFPPSYLPGLGLDYPAFRERNPRLVLTSVTPFGQTGPWAEYRANNLVLSNLSGHAHEHPGPVNDPTEQPPLQLAAHQAEFIAGLSAATAAMLALNRRQAGGGGCHVDACGFWKPWPSFPKRPWPTLRWGGRLRGAAGRTIPASRCWPCCPALTVTLAFRHASRTNGSGWSS